MPDTGTASGTSPAQDAGPGPSGEESGTAASTQGAASVASDITIDPDTYTAGPLAVTLRNDTRDEEVTGRFAVNNGRLTLSDAEGNIGRTSFPMTCALRQSHNGLMIEQVGDDPCALTGLILNAQD